MRPIPVLMYHHVAPRPDDMVTVTPEIFEGQMRHLAEAGYRAISLEDLLRCIRGEMSPGGRTVAITFDDAWVDNYLFAYPILERYGLPAAVFVVTDWADSESGVSPPLPGDVLPHREAKKAAEGGKGGVALGWELIGRMRTGGRISFYSHTRSHRKCDRIPGAEVREELRRSKETLETRLGVPCPFLCWPYGKFDDDALRMAREAGYRAIFTTRHGVVRRGADPFAIPRIVVKDDVAWFRRRMAVYTNPALSRIYLAVKKR
jgi:peptidoglycan/xylan/chitin deacetylase (PgdA/CDA1 family)